MQLYRTAALLAVLTAACDRGPEGAGAQKRIETMSRLAVDSQQARLWQTAASGRAGLERIPVADSVVQSRQRAAVPSVRTQKQEVGLPAGMRGGIALVSVPPGDTTRLSGTVRIARVAGERIELELSPGRTLALFARARGGPLRLNVGESANLDLRMRDDPADRQLIVALRTPQDGVVSVLETGPRPVTVNVPSFQLGAQQIGQPERGTMSVAVTVGGTRRVLTQGQIVDFPEGNLTVGLAASSALTGAEAHATEGNPYAINLVAWRIR